MEQKCFAWTLLCISVTWANYHLYFKNSAQALGLRDAADEALKGSWWPLLDHGNTEDTRQPGLAGRTRRGGSQHWGGAGPSLGNTLRELLMPFQKCRDPNWMSVCWNQSPLATSSVGDLQLVSLAWPSSEVYSHIAQAGYHTSPRLSFPICKTPTHRVMVGYGTWLTPLYIAPQISNPITYSSPLPLKPHDPQVEITCSH